MPTAYVRLRQPVPSALAAELERRLFFVSSEIDDFRFIGDDAIEAVEIEVAGSGETADVTSGLEAKINDVVDNEVLRHRVVPPKVVWQSSATGDCVTDIFPELAGTGVAFEAGEGQVAVGEPFLSLLEYLDRRLRSIALGFAGAVEYRYPTLIPTAALDRVKYFGSFPHHAMLVTRLHNDLDVYRAFAKQYAAGGALTGDVFSHCHDHSYCLPPTMCYHTFHQHQGRRLAGETVVTSVGKSFRFESKYRRGLERLWDFTIREVVFMGAADFVVESRRRVMDKTFAFIEELGLAGHCEAAADHFFATPDAADRILSQHMMELKYEIRLRVAVDRLVAVGSFNLHGDWFGKAFKITADGDRPIASGCAGFGLERLTYAFLCQHGLDRRRWPAAVTREIA